jgi:cytoplasmic iron level regulating protein YaaA (DUF328/UPF0246 family)
MAPVGHLWMQSRQRMHSGLFGVLTGSTPILQMRAHFPQSMHLSLILNR